MRYDFVVPNEGVHAHEAVKKAAIFEDMRWEGLWFTDHVIGLKAFDPVYGAYWLEVLTSMAYVAANTKKARLGVGVLVVPYRNPVLTAKILSTIDFLSDGRVDFGVGTGWARNEYHALGQGEKFEQRGKITNESLDLMLKCWQGGEFAHESEFYNFRNIMFEPTPVQKPRIPLWIGARGVAKLPLARAAKYADYWHPTELSVEDFKEGSARLNELAGREIPGTMRLHFDHGTDPKAIVDKVNLLGEAGCVQVAVDIKNSPSFSALADIAEKILKAR